MSKQPDNLELLPKWLPQEKKKSKPSFIVEMVLIGLIYLFVLGFGAMATEVKNNLGKGN